MVFGLVLYELQPFWWDWAWVLEVPKKFDWAATCSKTSCGAFHALKSG